MVEDGTARGACITRTTPPSRRWVIRRRCTGLPIAGGMVSAARQGRAARYFAVTVSLGSGLAFSVFGRSFTLELLVNACADHDWTRRKHTAPERAVRTLLGRVRVLRQRHGHDSSRTSDASRSSRVGRRRAISRAAALYLLSSSYTVPLHPMHHVRLCARPRSI